MLKAILTVFVFASAGLAQSFPGGPVSLLQSKDLNLFLSPVQVRPADGFYLEAGALGRDVVPHAPLSSLTITKVVQEVDLTFTVTDHRGHFVRNLTPSDFTIRDNGASPERLTYFERQSELPLRLAIVVDSSDSVTFVFDYEKKVAAAFIKRILRRGSDLALAIGFNQEVRLVQDLTGDNNLLSRAIRQLGGGGQTALYDAVSAASQQLARVKDTQTARRAIILITDGEDNSSHVNLEQAEELAQRNECTVHVVSTNPATGRALEPSDRAMKELSQVTGGNFLHADTEQALEIAFSKIDKELRSQYLISYKPSNVSRDGSFHQLVVLGPEKLRIHHRAGYFAR
jgi:VWFA-related protein